MNLQVGQKFCFGVERIAALALSPSGQGVWGYFVSIEFLNQERIVALWKIAADLEFTVVEGYKSVGGWSVVAECGEEKTRVRFVQFPDLIYDYEKTWYDPASSMFIEVKLL